MIDQTGKASRGQASKGGRNVAPTHGELHIAGDEEVSKGCCGKDQLMGGVESGTEGGIQAMHLLWAQHT